MAAIKLNLSMVHLSAPKYIETSAPAEVSEAAEDGAGTITFLPARDWAVFRPGAQPVAWLANRKCADGAVIIQNADSSSILLVELKSKVSVGMWGDIKLQLEGLLLNTVAALKLRGAPDVGEVKAYVAFTKDRISTQSNPSPATLKLPLGKPSSASLTGDWEAGVIRLLGHEPIILTKIQRDSSGNASVHVA